MRRKILSLLVGLSVGWSSPLLAQVPDWVNQLLTAAQLPVATAAARQAGVTSDEIRAVLDALGSAGVPAFEATALIDTTRAVRRDYGHIDNFGGFVQSQLAAGKRGRDLAAAIRAEHMRQGKGNAARGSSGEDRGTAEKGRGRGNSTKPPGGRGAPDEKQGNRGRGRPPNR